MGYKLRFDFDPSAWAVFDQTCGFTAREQEAANYIRTGVPNQAAADFMGYSLSQYKQIKRAIRDKIIRYVVLSS